MKQLNVRLDENLYKKIKILSVETNLSIQIMIHTAMVNYLSNFYDYDELKEFIDKKN